MRVFKYCTIFIFIISLCSCGKDEFFNQDKAIENGAWDFKNKIEFTVDVTDTTSFYDFYIDFRHNDSYEYSDIYFFFTCEFPNGKQAKDTIRYIMQDIEGKWFGKNTGSLIENHMLIMNRRKTRFPNSGKYKFSISHAMRDEKLNGIEDVGLTISKKE